jgi:hypothetical protein
MTIGTLAESAGSTSGRVLIYAARANEPEHERAVYIELGRRIARLLDLPFGGAHDARRSYPGRNYILPTDTIIGLTLAGELGLREETDLFGGVAPYPFVPTKAITHPLFSAGSFAPPGWSHDFSRRVSRAVLRGTTVFSLDDARQAGTILLRTGPLRLKPVLATAGRGQQVVRDERALEAALAEVEPDMLMEYGLVLEENLKQVQTFSVGRVRVGNDTAAYVGTQRLTRDNQGETVYGGSDLLVARGGFDQLMALPLDETSLQAIRKARCYDESASACFPGLLASRRNYDIALGQDAAGQWRIGVLEQSWRPGGASAAEIRALETLREQPGLQAVRASTLELFGERPNAPEGALLMYKYVMVKPWRGQTAASEKSATLA